MADGNRIALIILEDVPVEIKVLLVLLVVILIFILILVTQKGGPLKTLIGIEGLELSFYQDEIPNLPKSDLIRQSFEKSIDCFNQERYNDALAFLKYALEENPAREEKTAIYNFIGLSHMTLGNLPEAEENFSNALDNAMEPLGEAIVNGNLGIVYNIKGDLDKAITHHEKSLMINEELERKESIAKDYTNLGNLYRITDNLDKAIQWYEKSLKINEELERKESIAKDYTNLGNLYSIKGEPDKAIQWYEKSLELAYPNGFLDVIKIDLPYALEIYTNQNKLDKAKELKQKFKEKYPQLEI
ncbi:MAG: tetratricopeptide repeat protein [Candidatus Hydrothermarchaeales archaeon]